MLETLCKICLLLVQCMYFTTLPKQPSHKCRTCITTDAFFMARKRLRASLAFIQRWMATMRRMMAWCSASSSSIFSASRRNTYNTHGCHSHQYAHLGYYGGNLLDFQWGLQPAPKQELSIQNGLMCVGLSPLCLVHIRTCRLAKCKSQCFHRHPYIYTLVCEPWRCTPG